MKGSARVDVRKRYESVCDARWFFFDSVGRAAKLGLLVMCIYTMWHTGDSVLCIYRVVSSDAFTCTGRRAVIVTWISHTCRYIGVIDE